MQRYGDTAWSTSQWARIRGDDELRLALTISHPMNVMRRAPQDRPEVACAEGEILRETAELVDAGKLKPLIDSARFTFAQVNDAHAFFESKKHVGKIVLEAEDWG